MANLVIRTKSGEDIIIDEKGNVSKKATKKTTSNTGNIEIRSKNGSSVSIDRDGNVTGSLGTTQSRSAVDLWNLARDVEEERRRKIAEDRKNIVNATMLGVDLDMRNKGMTKSLYRTSDEALSRRARGLTDFAKQNPQYGIDAAALNKAVADTVYPANEKVKQAAEKVKQKNEKAQRIASATKAATTTDFDIAEIDRIIADNKKKSEDLNKRYAAANEALGVMRSNENQAVMYSDFYKGYQPSDYYKENEAIYKQNLGEYKDLEELNRAIQNADRDVERYEGEKKKYQYNEDMAKKYSGLQAQSDFGALAERGKASLPKYSSLTDVRNMSDEDVAALYINSDDDTRRNIRGIYEYSGLLENYDYLDDQQKNTYNAIRASEGEKAGLEYLKFIDPILQRKGYFTQQEDLIAKVDGNAGAAVLENAGTVLTSPLRGVDFLGAAADRAFGLNQDALGSARDYVMNPTKASTIVRSTTQENIESPVLRFAYNAGMSVLDNAMNIVTTGALGLPAGSTAAKNATLALMGSGAASQTYSSAKEKGLTEDEALSYGFLIGSLEAATEKIGLDNLFEIIDSGDVNSVLKFFKTMGKQALPEAGEEGLSNLGGAFIDRYVSGDLSDYNLTVQKYTQDGMSYDEAKKKANSDFWKDFGTDVLAGGVSGIAMGGGAAAINAVANSLERNEQNKERGRAILDVYGYDNLMKLAEETVKRGEGRQERSLQRTTDRIKGKPNSAHYVEMNPQVATKIYDKATKAEVAQKTRTDDIEQNIKSGTPLKASDVKKVSKAIVSDIVNKKSYSAEKYDKMLDGYTFTDLNEKGESAKRAKILDVIKYQYEQKQAEYNERVKKNAPVSEPVETVVPKAEDLSVSEDGVARDTDGNEVKIVSISSATTKNGKTEFVYKLDNGETISAKNVEYASQDEAILYESIANMGTNAAAANALVKAYNAADGISVEAYVNGIAEAYRYGKYGYDLNSGVYSEKLTPIQRNTAYRLGEQFKEGDVAEKTSRIETMKASAQGEQKVGKLSSKSIARNDTQATTLAIMDNLSKILGVDFYVFESYEKGGKRFYTDSNGAEQVSPNGWFDPSDNSIHIDLNAGSKGEGLMLYTLSHELTHFIKKWSPAKFDVLANFLVEKFGTGTVEQLVARQIEKAKANDREPSYDAAFEEVVAESMETMLSSGNVLETLAELKKQDKTLWQKIVDFLKDFVDNIKKLVSAYEGRTPDSVEGNMVADMKDFIAEFEFLYAEALYEASENYQHIGSRNLKDFEAAKNTDGESLFQYRAMEADEDAYRVMLKKWGKVSDAEIDTLFNTIDKAMDIIKDNLEVLDYAWEADINDRAFSPVKPNSDSLYQVSLDFSTLCRKRLLQQSVQGRLQEALNKPLTREEGIAIRDALIALQEDGRQIEVACALCYVESARMKSPAQIKKFIKNREAVIKDFFASKNGGDMKAKIKQAETDARERLGVGEASLKSMPKKIADQIRAAKKEAKASYVPTTEEQKLIDIANGMTVADFTSPEGLENLAKNYRDLFDAYTSYIRNATKSKGIENDTWWRAGDSASISDTLIANMNMENGLRSQSWSDFQVIHLLDYIAATIELSTRNAKEQAYTKVPDFVELMGNTGVMINLSLIPTRDFNGNLEYDSTEGMAYEVAKRLRDKYHATAGTICIGVDNVQIKLLLGDTTIDYVIPYHRSGMAKHIRKAMHIPTWSEYEQYQSESNLSDAEAAVQAKKYGVKLLAKSDKNYQRHTSFSEWFDLKEAQQIAKMENTNPSDRNLQKQYGVMYGGYMAMQNAANNYLKLCAERGLAPKFSHEKADFTGEANYWKLLIDRKMVDNVTGEIIEQQSIKPIFDEGEILRILNDELERYPKVKADQEYAERKVTEKFLSGEIKEGMSAKAIADVMKTPVDNITTTNILEHAQRAQFLAVEENDAILSMVDRVLHGSFVGKEKIYFGDVSSRVAEQIQKLTGIDVTGFRVAIEARQIEHILKDHGENGKADRSMSDPRNIAKMEYALTDPDSITEAGRTKAYSYEVNGRGKTAKTVLYEKEIGEKSYYVVQAVPDAKAKTLYIVTAFIGKKGYKKGTTSSEQKGNALKEVPQLDNAQSPVATSESASVGASKERVPQPNSTVKPSENNSLQLRSTEGLSNRELLANALETAAQNDIEKRRIAEYKGKVDMLNAQEAKLREINGQIKDISFGKGKRDTQKLRDLQDEKVKTTNRINTLDKSLLTLEASKPLQDVLQREKQKAYKVAEQRGKEALVAYREKAAETQREIITRYQESKKRGIESRKMTEMRGKIKSVVNELNNLLLHGSKDKHVMIGLQKVVAEALDIINMDTVNADARVAKYNALIAQATDPDVIKSLTETRDRIQNQGDKFKAKMDNLKSAYANIKNSDDPLVANAYDEVIAQRMDHVAEVVGNTSLRDMSLEQLGEVYEMYKMVLTTVRNSNKAFKAKRNETISVLANRTMEEIHKVGGTKQLALKALQGMKAFSWNNLKPVYALRAIGSDTFTEAFDNVRAGEDTWAVDVNEAKSFFDNISKKYGYKNWDFKKRYKFKSTTGVDFELSLEQILSLYAYSKREQADKHLEKGGFVFDSAIEVTEKKGKLGIPLKYTVNTSTAHNLSKEGLAKIIGTLSWDQKMFVDIMQGYLSDVMGAKGNEVSLEMYGVKLFNEDNYFPLKSAKQFMFEQNESAGEVKIKNSSFSKETVVNASNPIILSNFMDVWANHVNDMAMYHSFVLPLEDFNRIFNYKTPTSANMNTESVKMYMQNAYGTQSVQYIKDLITDLNGGVRSDPRESTGKKLISKFKKASVMASLSVAIQQPSAVARALSEIDAKYFFYNPNMITKKMWDNEVKKYAPVAIIKEMGRFDTDMGRSTVDYIKGATTAWEKTKKVVDNGLGFLPDRADRMTWCHIWNAVKRETLAKNKSMDIKSEEFLKKVGERFTEVVTRTQVYDSVMARSANMRSKSGLMAMITAFLAEPTTSINMIENGIRQSKRGHKGAAARSMGAVFASIVLNSALVSLVYSMRDDDEDETWVEKYLGSFTTEVIDGINPLTYVPIVKDVWSIMQGFDVERSDMSMVSDLWDAIEGFTKTAATDTSEMDEEELAEHRSKMVEEGTTLVGTMSSLFGVPLKNIIREIKGGINLYNTLSNGLDNNAASLWDEVLESAKGGVPILGRMKDEPKEDKLYKAIMDGDAAYRKRIESQYKDQTAVDNAIRKALRNNDPRIKQAAEAYYNGNIAEYTRIAKAVIADGFKQDIVVKSIMTEVNALKPDEDTDTSSKATGLYKTEAFLQAIMSGDQATADLVRKDLIDTMVANGKTEEEATKSLEGSVSKDCREKFMEGNLTETEAIEVLVNYCGNERDAAEEKVGKWSFEVDYGFSWDDKADAYKNGEISASELKAVLMDVGGKTAEDADLQVQIYNWQKEVPNCDDITASAIKDYNEYCKPAGITKSVYYNAWRTFEDTPSDYDSDGEAIRYSKTKKVMPKIKALPISSKQKTALALCWWAEGTVNEYKLW